MDEYNGRLNRAVLSMLTRKKERVHYFSKRASSLNPRNYIGQYRLLLIELQKRLNTAIVNEQRLQRKRLHEIAGRLGSLSPLGIMERGYSICFSLPEKKILRDSRSVSRGDAVMVKLSAGGMTCTVLDTQSPVQINQQKTPH
ncbi:MAG: exodeoxyribonuclease VII large subunit, partial [Nitrospinota bacterium]